MRPPHPPQPLHPPPPRRPLARGPCRAAPTGASVGSKGPPPRPPGRRHIRRRGPEAGRRRHGRRLLRPVGLVGLVAFNLLLGPLAIGLAVLALRRRTPAGAGRALLGLALGVADLAVLAALITANGTVSWSLG